MTQARNIPRSERAAAFELSLTVDAAELERQRVRQWAAKNQPRASVAPVRKSFFWRVIGL